MKIPSITAKASPVLLGVVLAAGIASAPAAWAAPSSVVAQRTVVVGDLVHGTFYGGDSPYAGTGEFIDKVSEYLGGTHEYPGYPDFTTRELVSSEQQSYIDPAGVFEGTGSVSMGFSLVDADLAHAQSWIDVTFDLASAHSYTLTGTLASHMDGGLGLALVSLAGPTSFSFAKQGWGSLALAESGTLAPGSYHLTIATLIQPECEPAECTAFSWMGGSSSFDAVFEVTAVPEPSTYAMLLAGLGLLGFAAWRKGPRRERP